MKRGDTHSDAKVTLVEAPRFAHQELLLEYLESESPDIFGTGTADEHPSAVTVPDKRAAAHYQVGDLIGHGAEGLVHSSTQTSLARQVALKTLRPERASERTRARLVKEAKITASLEHPHIMPIYDLVDSDEPTVVMKRIAGRSLQEILAARRDDIDLDHLEIFLKVCDAIAFAHSKGVIHRDIKPANILVGDFGEVYVTDWGIAGTVEDFAKEQGMYGTPAYMAPEMVNADCHHRVDKHSDIYLLGALLFEIIEGHAPHHCGSLLQVLIAASEGELTFSAKSPQYLVQLCQRAMAKDPQARIGSVVALRDEVARYMKIHGALQLITAGRDAHDSFSDLTEAESLMANYNRARFAYEQALAVAPGLEDAEESLTELMRDVVEFQLANDRPALALSLAESCEYTPKDTLEKSQTAARREQLARDQSLAQYRRGRFLMLRWMLPVGLLCVIGTLFRQYLSQSVSVSTAMIVAAVPISLGLLALAWISRGSNNRWMRFAVLSLFGLQVVMVVPAIAGPWLGLSADSIILARKAASLSMLTTFALVIEWRLLLAAALYAVGMLGFARYGEIVWLDAILQMGTFLLVFLILGWRHHRERANALT